MAPAPVPLAPPLDVLPLRRQHIHGLGAWIRPRIALHLQPGAIECVAVDGRGPIRGRAARDPHGQAPRRVLPVALGLQISPWLAALGEEGRGMWWPSSWPPPGSVRGLLPLAMGFARELLWRHSSLQRVLLASAPRASYWFSSLAADALTRHFVLACRYGPISEVWLDGAKSPSAVNMSYDFELWFDMIHPRCQHLFRRCPRHLMGWERVWRGRTTMLGDGEQIFHYDRQERWPVLDVLRECWNRLAPSGVRYVHQARNCLLLLNVPPNSSGLIDESDFQTLERFSSAIDSIFSVNLAANPLSVTASSVHSSSFGPKQILDERMETFWAPMQGESTGWIELDLGKVSKFNALEIRERGIKGHGISRQGMGQRAGLVPEEQR
ncbi:hypothetical protein SELMODRAFT_442783 [Selaginella moellendorffii]|uniref:F5/8 type C domain-containing protein n=1 Tax=Selaginella moellendorffii TaxID=88036 RepID=D8RW33_SELML|nr:hypothetical protein SELMODRAFT_442783 [Selaginella moellendorffii]